MKPSIQKSEAEWEEQLSPLEYQVCRRRGTEIAFTGAYWNCHEPGIYHCVCCNAPLFSSRAKYDSGTGWPSFWAPVGVEAIRLEQEPQVAFELIEALCAACGAHLGHVFPDGPPPTGLRFCLNSVALRLRSETTSPDPAK